jgi:hypothetical protein
MVDAMFSSHGALDNLSDELQARHGRWLLKLLAAMYSYAYVPLTAPAPAGRQSQAYLDSARILSCFGCAESSFTEGRHRSSPGPLSSLSPKRRTELMAALLSQLWSVNHLETLLTFPLCLQLNAHVSDSGASPLCRRSHHAIKQEIHQLWRSVTLASSLRSTKDKDNNDGESCCSCLPAGCDPIAVVALQLQRHYFSKHPSCGSPHHHSGSVEMEGTDLRDRSGHEDEGNGATKRIAEGDGAISAAADFRDGLDSTAPSSTANDNLWDASLLVSWYQHVVKYARQRPKLQPTDPSTVRGFHNALPSFSENDGWVPLANVFSAWKLPLTSPLYHEWNRFNNSLAAIFCSNNEGDKGEDDKQHYREWILARPLWDMDVCVRLQWSQVPCRPAGLSTTTTTPLHVRATYLHKDAHIGARVVSSHPRVLNAAQELFSNDTTGCERVRWLDWIQLTENEALREFSKQRGRYLPPFRPYLFCVPESALVALVPPPSSEEAGSNSLLPSTSVLDAAYQVLNLTTDVILPEFNRHALAVLTSSRLADAYDPVVRRLQRILGDSPALENGPPIIMISFEGNVLEASLVGGSSDTWNVAHSLAGGGGVVIGIRSPADEMLYTGWALKMSAVGDGLWPALSPRRCRPTVVAGVFDQFALGEGLPSTTRVHQKEATSTVPVQQHNVVDVGAVRDFVVSWRQACVDQRCGEQDSTDCTAGHDWCAVQRLRLVSQHSSVVPCGATAAASHRRVVNALSALLKSLTVDEHVMASSNSLNATTCAAPLLSSMYAFPFTRRNNPLSLVSVGDAALFDTARTMDVVVLTTAGCLSVEICATSEDASACQPLSEWVLVVVPHVRHILNSRFVEPCIASMIEFQRNVVVQSVAQPLAADNSPDSSAARRRQDTLMLRLEEALDLAQKDPLEFLGDAVVDYLYVMEYLYGGALPFRPTEPPYPTAHHQHRDASGLGRFMAAHTSNLFLGGQLVLGNALRRHLALRWHLHSAAGGGVDADSIISSVTEPKAYGDVTEAIAGAVFLHALVDWMLPISVALDIVRNVLGVKTKCVLST